MSCRRSREARRRLRRRYALSWGNLKWPSLGEFGWPPGFLYRPEKRASDYLALAGGTTKRADTSQIFVLKADGSVAGAGRSWFGARSLSTNVMPGDSIVVPEDYERTTWMKDLRDWTQILYQFGLGAAGIKVLGGN